MGKKRYNWKARNISDIEIDNTETKKVFLFWKKNNFVLLLPFITNVSNFFFFFLQIPLDIEHRKDNYDNCNALVLPNKKRNTKNKEKKISVTRILSKKRRKQLEKIVEKKQKKLQVSCKQ